MTRWTPLAPEYPWEVPVSAVALISSALAVGRPGGLDGPRFNGRPDDEVAGHYSRLREAALTLAQAHGADIERFERLESAPAGTSSTRWETWVVASGAADDLEAIRLAREVWAALGEAEYHRRFQGRPRTWRGVAAGRAWMFLALIPATGIVAAGARSGAPDWLVFAGAGCWMLLTLAAFWRSYRRRARTPWAELPHL